jgi:glycine/D-amino acid oxidase-like deaminating enzyme
MADPLDDPGALPRTAYSDAAPPAPPAPSLAGDISVDIAVIGAGFTGLSAALHAAEAGARVAVLEAHEIGWGASGRNFGQVVPYLRHEPGHVLRRLGPDWGERLIQAAASGADLVFDLIMRHGIECQAIRNGLIFAAHKPSALLRLESRAAFWRDRGAELPMLGPAASAAAIGGGAYWGALLEPRGGVINALGYVRGLARAAIKTGATIHTRSRARGISRHGSRWRVATPTGVVATDAVLICTGAYNDDVWPGLQRTMIPVRAYQLVSRPIADNLRGGILPGGRALTDTRNLISGVRLHADGRLHVSGDGPPFGLERRPGHATSARRILSLFPQLGSVEFEQHWSGWLDMTPDQFPRLYEPAGGILAGLGYSGRGIALATIMGRELARRAMGAGPSDFLFPISDVRPIPLRWLARGVVHGLMTLYRFQDTLDAARFGRRPISRRNAAAHNAS